MISKLQKHRMDKIIEAISRAAAGDYSGRLDIASDGDALGAVEDAVNKLLETTGAKFSAMTSLCGEMSNKAGRYERMLENLVESYFEVDLKGSLLFFNGAALENSGYTKEELLGLHFHRLMNQANAQKVYDEFHKVFLTGDSVKGFEWEITKKNGEKLVVESSIALLRDEKGQAIGFQGVVRDISSRNQAERALCESQRKYDDILTHMRDFYLEADLKGNFIFFNDALCRALGYAREELPGINYRLVNLPEQFQDLYKLYNEIYFTGKSKGFVEHEMIRKDGSRIYAEFSVSLLCSSAGEPIGFVHFGREITERLIARKKIEESERRLRLVTDNIADIIWTMDFDMRLTYVSPSVSRMTGLTPEEMMKTPVEAIVPPDKYMEIKQILADRLEKKKTGSLPVSEAITVFDFPFNRKNGNSLWVEISTTFSRDETGKAFEIVGVTRDITERKRAEEALKESEKRYRMIVENVHEMVWSLDLDFHFICVSPAYIRLTGFSEEEIKTMAFSDLLTPESFELATEILAKELALESSGKPFDPNRYRIFELGILGKDGHHIYVEIAAAFNRDENGRPIEILAVGRDITERKKAAEEKERMQKQLVQVQKMETVGRLAGGVAHDFNNMLTVILGSADLAKMHKDQKDAFLKDIEEIQKAAIRSRDITKQLLAFSRRQTIEPRLINLNELIGQIQKTLTRLIGENIELAVIPGENLSIVKFDRSQIEQILMNLAVNSRDAMPYGGKITIETQNSVLDDFYCEKHLGFVPGCYVQLSVSDTGAGMDEEMLEHILEPFFTTKEVGKGTGLGLATVYGIVKQNNSFIDVYSEPGHGTAFHIYIPHASGEEDFKNRFEEEPVKLGRGNVLLVEDDIRVLEVTKGMLESLGYNVVVAENPADALSSCEKDRCIAVDLVITDVIMPFMSGQELRKKLAEIRPNLKVLFISGYMTNTVVRHGILDEGVRFLQKPFTLNDLALKLREILESDEADKDR
jgi:two-component system, cell cycle sensor histidine kinase and response regulator CckA